MEEPLTSIAWESPNGIAPALEQDVRDALAQDVGFGVTAGDPYFGGKQFSALARLALIADELGETSLAAGYRNTLGTCPPTEAWQGSEWGPPCVRSDLGRLGLRLQASTTPVLPLVRATTTTTTFITVTGFMQLRPWPRTTQLGSAQWGDEVMHLIRDIAEPSGADPHYGYMRNKDWFVGHSWAAGLFEFGDARNQESSSEAVNAWYGVYLYGLAIEDDRIRDLGRMMLATELRATWKYWQINAGEGIYPEPFASNKVVGILWGTQGGLLDVFRGQHRVHSRHTDAPLHAHHRGVVAR